MHVTSGSHFSLPLLSGRLPECSLTCEADNQVPMMFDARVRRLLRIWSAAWAVACFVCSFFTITTFLVDLSRFAYPVRPILYLAMCYLAVSVVFMFGKFLKNLSYVDFLNSRRRCWRCIRMWHVRIYTDSPRHSGRRKRRMQCPGRYSLLFLHGQLCVVACLVSCMVSGCQSEMGSRIDRSPLALLPRNELGRSGSTVGCSARHQLGRRRRLHRNLLRWKPESLGSRLLLLHPHRRLFGWVSLLFSRFGRQPRVPNRIHVACSVDNLSFRSPNSAICSPRSSSSRVRYLVNDPYQKLHQTAARRRRTEHQQARKTHAQNWSLRDHVLAANCNERSNHVVSGCEHASVARRMAPPPVHSATRSRAFRIYLPRRRLSSRSESRLSGNCSIFIKVSQPAIQPS